MTAPRTEVDWLRFRVRGGPWDGLDAMRGLFGQLGPRLTLGTATRGMLGFQQGRQILLADVAVGRVDYGGESQRGWARFDIPGSGCAWVQDWDAVQDIEAMPEAELRRVDIALTTYQREVTHERVVDAHAAGRFITRGRPPVLEQRLFSEHSRGRTCYIGTREGSEKFGRFYEKGRQLAEQSSRHPTHIDGFPVDDIYRCEIEFKVQSRPIPWEIVERRDQYFAGAYPFCADVLPGCEADILKGRAERHAQASLADALHNVRTQFGAVLFTAMHAYEGDISAVWERIVGEKHCRALVEAGVLMTDHYAQDH